MPTVVPMSKEQAEQYVSYTYAPPYAFYNIPEDYRREALESVLSPASGNEMFAVLDDAGNMIGFYEYTHHVTKNEIELGLGLAPEQTGRGRGRAFVAGSLAFAKAHFPSFNGTYVLRVAEFNLRARRVYEALGFVPYDRQYTTCYGAPVTFLCMRLSQNACAR